MLTRIKTPAEIAIMREGGKMLATILAELSLKVGVGVTPKDLAASASQKIKALNLQPVLLGYQGFPDVICISVNEGVVHGIPGRQPFKDGDVVKLDLTIGHKKLIVDAAVTVVIGKPSEEVSRLVEGTQKALMAGIRAIDGDGVRVGNISAAVQDQLTKYHLGIVRDLVGHGVGFAVHEDPNIPNYGPRNSGPSLPAGTTIAIEPMATLGTWQIEVLHDGWTIVTTDNSLAAHFEHTVAITDNGAEILTQL